MIPIIQFTDGHIYNPNPGGEVTLDEFFDMRADLVEVCQQFGPTGYEDLDLINRTGPKLKFWVVEDMSNDEELYQYVQVYDPQVFSEVWLRAVIALLHKHAGWGVGISNLDQAYLLVFGDRLLVKGEAFAGCHDVTTVAQAGAQNIAHSLANKKSDRRS